MGNLIQPVSVLSGKFDQRQIETMCQVDLFGTKPRNWVLGVSHIILKIRGPAHYADMNKPMKTGI